MAQKELTIELIKTVHMVKRNIDSRLSRDVEENCTVPQAHVMGFIHDNSQKGPIFQRDIEEAFELHRSSVSLMLSNMEKQGYIQRIPSQQDGRLKQVVLTSKGEQCHRVARDKVQEANQSIMEVLTQSEQTQLRAILGKIQDSLK